MSQRSSGKRAHGRWPARLGAGLASLGLSLLPACHASPPGPDVRLADYRLTFDEPFDKLDVSPWGPGTRWIAHTPWHGDFGDAHFVDPTPAAPFAVGNGLLAITMTRDKGVWQSGLLASSDEHGNGFLQSGGYFEMRAKLPPGSGVWPAFWLCGLPKPGRTYPEVDIVEYYGHDPASYFATTHIWQDGKSLDGLAIKIDVPPRRLEAGFHTYGVSIDPKSVIYYLDRHEVARQPSKSEYMKPMMLLVNLAAGGGWPIDALPPTSTMVVDYIRAYRHR